MDPMSDHHLDTDQIIDCSDMAIQSHSIWQIMIMMTIADMADITGLIEDDLISMAIGKMMKTTNICERLDSLC